ncbi:hypothetical protein RUND412_009724 [Rhizina undulata]
MNFGHDLIRTVADDRARNIPTLLPDNRYGANPNTNPNQLTNPNGYRLLPNTFFENDHSHTNIPHIHPHGPHAQQLLDLRNETGTGSEPSAAQRKYSHAGQTYATAAGAGGGGIGGGPAAGLQGVGHVPTAGSPQLPLTPGIHQLNSPVSPPAGSNGVGVGVTYDGGETSVNVDCSTAATPTGSASLKRKEMDSSDQGDGSSKPRIPMYPGCRKRAMTACARCRSRKTRCDNERPKCAYCVRAGVDCRYPNEPPTISVETSMILDRLASLESLLQNQNQSQSQNQNQHICPSHSLKARTAGPPPPPSIPPTYYPSPSSLTVPAQPQVTLNSIFSWPIFSHYFSSSEYAEIQDTLHPFYMEPNIPPSNPQTHAVSTDIHHLKTLVKRFLQEVHTKNPILDARTLDRYTLDVAEYGALWDSKSCLVLLVCALGSAASAYEPTNDHGDEKELERQRLAQRDHVEVAKGYFAAAQKRLGGVMGENTMVPVQILFLVGMYHMYTLQPLAAWKMFHAASVSLQAYLSTRRLKCPEPEWSQSLEQRLFWSCLKSECDIREEVPLPDSGLSDIDYPDTFPTPPPDLSITTTSPSSPPSSTPSTAPDLGKDLVTTDTQVRSWYYYLAEIALRRLLNRVQNTWCHRPQIPHSEMLEVASDFEDQLDQWYHSLPEALKFPLNGILLDDELLQHLRSRYLRIQEMVYSPFIKAVIHDHAAAAKERMRECAERGLQVLLLVTMNGSSTAHRHHGTWYACRGHSAASLILLAVALRNRGVEGPGVVRLPDGWLVGVERTEKLLDVWAGELHSLRKARDLMVRVKEVVLGESG